MRMLVKNSRLWLIILALLVALPALAANFEEEVNAGKKASEEVAKESKFIEDAALLERVRTIGDAIAKVATNTEIKATYGKPTLAKFDYSFKIIDDKDANAFALPGGFVYVNKGLLDYVQSDDELAGVLAHEISHVAHHHGMQLLKTEQKQLTAMALALIVGATAGVDTNTIGELAQAMTLVRIAKLNSYGQDAEIDADRTAVAYLAQTKYNPVGMLTFMERYARDEVRKPQINFGIFATHPPSTERARWIMDEIEKRKIPINRRLVTTYMKVEVKPVPDSAASSVWIGDIEVIRLADSGGEKSSARAQHVADKLGKMLLSGAGLRDVKVGGGSQYVTIMDQVLISPTAEDVALTNTSIAEVVNASATALRKALLQEFLNEKY